MSDEPGDRVGVACPACSPDAATVHEVLNPGGQATVRCTACDHVHKTALPDPETVQCRVVISQDGESLSAQETVPAEERLAVGEEFVVDAEEALMTVRITSLEGEDGGRSEAATAGDVATIWTRAVGNVSVPVTLHPADGARDETKSLDLQVPGDHEFRVGDVEEIADREFAVETILVRDDARAEDRTQVEERGDAVAAKDVKRLYARDQSTVAWSAW